MKKILAFVVLVSILMVSCKQTTKSPTVKNESTLTTQEQTVKEAFVDTDGKSLTAVYNTHTEKPTVSISYENYENITLTQTKAWSKGAEYTNDNLTWVTTKTGGNLIVDDKTISFSIKK